MTPLGFWEKVDVKGESDCWNWMAGTCQGYGHVRCGNKIKKAHRVAYEDKVGPVPDGKILMHTCDNRICCNPAHLKAGTIADNNKDRDTKGRQVALSGEQHARSRLNEKAVKQIRKLQSKHAAEKRRLAEKLGVDVVTVGDVMRGKTWRVVQ